MRKVEASILIQQPASKVFSAFTDPALIKGWWGIERSLIENKQGGVYSLAWEISKKGFRYISTGIITVYKPGQELLIDQLVYFNPDKQILGPTWLHIKFREQDANNCLVELVQGGYDQGGDWDWFYNSVLDAWPKVLVTLKEFLDGA